ncbi:MAG: 50S ribosomal protein L5 [Chloroflexi bacterium]|nr:50S ribosomal protein L5 [Chloroflexota bacterium]
MISDDLEPETESGEQDQVSGAVNGDSPTEAAVATENEPQPADSAVETTEAAGEEQKTPAPRRQRSARSGGTSRRQRGGATAVAVEEPPPVTEGAPPPRLLETYRTEIVPAMMREFGFANPMRVPRVEKIVLNIGMGEALTNSRAMDGATSDLTTITGQKPVINRARKSIAGFKIREGNPIGTSVTLRGARMYHFLDRLINIALPRIRDFRGLPRGGFDGRGNFSIGIREQIIFPEIDYNQIDRIRGLQVTIATSARNDEEAIRLLELYGMPFVRQA